MAVNYYLIFFLRQGSIQNERSKDDPYYLVRQRLIKFQEQMSVVVIVWRDCQQLIENYCQEEVKVILFSHLDVVLAKISL